MHRRRHGRVKARGVSSIVRTDGQLAPASAVENLSMGGAYLRTPNPMRTGTKIVLDLMRPELPKAIRLSGRVVSTVSPDEASARHQPPGMGIQFDPLSVQLERQLRELLLLIAPDPTALDGDGTQEIGKAIELTLIEPVTSMSEPIEPELLPEADEPLTPVEAAPARVPLAPVVPLSRPAPETAAPLSDSARLMVQVKGLLLELSEWQAKVDALERANQSVREEISAEWQAKLEALQLENETLREELQLAREAMARR